MHLKTRRGWRL